MSIARMDWDFHVTTLRPGEFCRRHRMSEEKFMFHLIPIQEQTEFFRELTPEKRRLHRCCYGVDPLDSRHKLAAALRWIAGGSYLDIRLVHGMSQSMLHSCIWNAVDAINSSEELKMYIPGTTSPN